MDGDIRNVRQDLINFIGSRIVAAMRGIKPKLGGNSSSEEESCAEQEAVYLIGLSDGLALAELMAVSVNERG
jgi:hypothetical protein